ncbi:MAG: hypothetical protein AAGF12_43605, partial [Myxococcota bacterium]
ALMASVWMKIGVSVAAAGMIGTAATVAIGPSDPTESELPSAPAGSPGEPTETATAERPVPVEAALEEHEPAAPPADEPEVRAPAEVPAELGTGLATPQASLGVHLLRQARGQVGANPSHALALVEEHQALHPGSLQEEREVIRIRALTRLGRAGEVVERAEQFLARFPSSTYRQEIESLLEES